MPDPINAPGRVLARQLVAAGAPLIAARLLASLELAAAALAGRDYPHRPSDAPLPEQLVDVAELLGIPLTLAEVDGDSTALEAHPAGAAYMAVWREGAAAQWGEAPDVFTAGQAELLAAALAGSEGLEDEPLPGEGGGLQPDGSFRLSSALMDPRAALRRMVEAEKSGPTDKIDNED
jgi:hypothetical protein